MINAFFKRSFEWAFYDDDDLVFYIPFNIIQVILRQWKGDNERFCAMKHCSVNSWDLNPGPHDLELRAPTLCQPDASWVFEDNKGGYSPAV